ncbi:replication factor A protein 2, partial [Lobosporangium transversale]
VFVRQATQHIYHIEDGTGEIDGKRFTVDDEDPAEYDNIVEGTYVRIVGNLKEYQQRLSVNVHSIRPIKDKNEITYHLLEVIYTHVNFTRSKIGGTNMNNMGMMMPTSQNNFNNHSSAGVDGLSVKTGDLPQKIAEMFQNRPNKDVSVHRRDIISKFAPVVGSAEAVNNVVESMIQNGFVYTVEDDDHLQFTY